MYEITNQFAQNQPPWIVTHPQVFLAGLGAAGDPPTVATETPPPETTTVAETGPWMLEATTALQGFSIISGITGAMAGFLLAQRTGDYTRVNASQILMATALSFVGTFAAVFVIRTIEEWPTS